MGRGNENISLPINEAVNFLSNNSSNELQSFKLEYPELANDLKPGIFCGGDTSEHKYIVAKAKIMVKTLKLASGSTKNALKKASLKIKTTDRLQTGSQILTLIGSSSVIGTIGMEDNTLHLISALITLMASCGSILIEHLSKIVSPSLGDVRDAYSALTKLTYELVQAHQELELAISYTLPEEKIIQLISQSNLLMSEVNKWNPQLFI